MLPAFQVVADPVGDDFDDQQHACGDQRQAQQGRQDTIGMFHMSVPLLSAHPGGPGEAGDQVGDRDGYLRHGQAGEFVDAGADMLADGAGDLGH